MIPLLMLAIAIRTHLVESNWSASPRSPMYCSTKCSRRRISSNNMCSPLLFVVCASRSTPGFHARRLRCLKWRGVCCSTGSLVINLQSSASEFDESSDDSSPI
ncbi:hypothetical protein PF005_g8908 [Phytophthora fragariae]|uniref:Secreted protein n=1 Tax=Phytophthora fragariae TaxID=53985 RepID=A0A6A3ZSG6_9STRA|nr:hypothetical protein PF003_g35960 [Phytophthora fragariae]KAE8940341.1 hypothetical protein PF009_g9844 [Phytophthora fragariae]KAE9117753.1 hypothetical protein PF010_g8488 [Phytophthora fragariae]KAE9118234.1 hypothetical protein PF007_g8997 [Phytophthora fragariae]KAE9147235.1 hypothetical protein PF006_g8060 [Phytophthora fragariae]